MALTSTQRWMVIGCAGIGTLAAMSWVDNREKQLNEVSAAIDTQTPDRKRAGPSDESAPEPEAPAVMPRAAQLRRAVSVSEVPDLFGDAAQPAPPPTAVSAAPIAPPVPEVPPLPFAYLGRITEDGVTTLFLVYGERNLAVKVGDLIDDRYRLERLTENTADFTYLPPNPPQTASQKPDSSKKSSPIKQSLTIKDSP